MLLSKISTVSNFFTQNLQEKYYLDRFLFEITFSSILTLFSFNIWQLMESPYCIFIVCYKQNNIVMEKCDVKKQSRNLLSVHRAMFVSFLFNLRRYII